MQIGIANGIPLNAVITGDDLVPAYDQSTGTEGYVNLTTAVQKAFSGSVAGTANGVLYLNGSKVATSGSALTFDGAKLSVSGSTAGSGVIKFGDPGDTNPYVGIYRSAASSINTNGNFLNLGGYDGIAFTAGNSVLASQPEKMRLTSAGLGIGTSSPARTLDVNGAIRISNGAPIEWGGTDYAIVGDTGGALIFRTAGSERARIDSAGNLGLGVTPSAWGGATKALDINTAGSVVASGNAFEFYLNGYWSGSAFIYKNTGVASKYEQSLGAHKWFTAPSGTAGDAISFTQAMTLDASGNLGIGTTTPSQRIDAVTSGGSSYIRNHNGTIESFSGVSEVVGGAVYGTGNNYPVTFFTNGAERARIDSSGNFLLGTTSIFFSSGGIAFRPGSISYSLTDHATGTATGNYYAAFTYAGTPIGTITQNGTTAVSYNTSSDYRLKNITGPVTNSGAYIDSLNPVEGTWKADGSTFVGLIAHEVQEVSRTQVATGEKDGAEMQAMDYSNSELIANLIAEVKSLRARVAALESN